MLTSDAATWALDSLTEALGGLCAAMWRHQIGERPWPTAAAAPEG